MDDSDLVAWLWDQLTEDAALAADWTSPYWTTRRRYVITDDRHRYHVAQAADHAEAEHVARYDPGWARQDAEAKLRILDDCLEAARVSGATWLLVDRTLRNLAAGFADRPGYDPDWAPLP